MRGMKPGPPPRLKLGDSIDGIIVKPAGGRKFTIKAKNVPDGWKVELLSKNPEQIHLGSAGVFWIAKISPLQSSVLVYDGMVGRLPISDAMRPRYLKCLRALISVEDMSGDEIGDLRSMLMSIEDRNKADWLTVWRVLGEPSTGDLKRFIADVNALRDARKDAPAKVASIRADIIATHSGMIETAIQRLDTE